jgi:hypothetical protein
MNDLITISMLLLSGLLFFMMIGVFKHDDTRLHGVWGHLARAACWNAALATLTLAVWGPYEEWVRLWAVSAIALLVLWIVLFHGVVISKRRQSNSSEKVGS